MRDTIDRRLKAPHRKATQVGGIKALWELGRHQFLVSVAPVSVVGGMVEYRDPDAVTKHIEPWIEAKPFRLQVHSCNSLEVTLRLISWALVHNLLIFGGDKFTRYYVAE